MGALTIPAQVLSAGLMLSAFVCSVDRDPAGLQNPSEQQETQLSPADRGVS